MEILRYTLLALLFIQASGCSVTPLPIKDSLGVDSGKIVPTIAEGFLYRCTITTTAKEDFWEMPGKKLCFKAVSRHHFSDRIVKKIPVKTNIRLISFKRVRETHLTEQTIIEVEIPDQNLTHPVFIFGWESEFLLGIKPNKI